MENGIVAMTPEIFGKSRVKGVKGINNINIKTCENDEFT